MNSNAPGQFAGYMFQFPRALYHLLQGKEGDVVSLEVIGDVGVVSTEGITKSEEDKASTVSNPVTDRSTNLWKTLYNWIQDIESGKLDVSKTHFILCINYAGQEGIADALSIAQGEEQAASVVKKIISDLSDIKKGHDIWEYYNYTINEHRDIFIKLIESFELQLSSPTGYEEVREAVIAKLVPKTQIDFIIENLSGWLLQEVQSKLSAKEDAIIRWEDFSTQFLVFFERVRRRELIDFTIQAPPSSEDIQSYTDKRPNFVQQLDAIEESDDQIIEAVTDFLRADINRQNWIVSELIDETVAQEFEDKLQKFWKNKNQHISLTQKTSSEVERGSSLYLECKMRQETIRGETPPDSTVSGTYHALADKPSLGWHPDWEEIINKKEV